MVAIFLGGSLSIMVGFLIAFVLFKGALGGGETIWGAMAALCASWIGGSAAKASHRQSAEVADCRSQNTHQHADAGVGRIVDWIFLIGLSLIVSAGTLSRAGTSLRYE